jgi:hypothetical protein
MTPKQFRKYLDRDGGCLHCGDATTAVPHHRINRGMGGSKARDGASNIIVMCSVMNGLMESDPIIASMAKEWGWKLESWQESDKVPVWHCVDQRWYLLDNSWTRSIK